MAEMVNMMDDESFNQLDKLDQDALRFWHKNYTQLARLKK